MAQSSVSASLVEEAGLLPPICKREGGRERKRTPNGAKTTITHNMALGVEQN